MPIKFWMNMKMNMNQLLLLVGKLSESGWFLNCIFMAANTVNFQRNVDLPAWNDDKEMLMNKYTSDGELCFDSCVAY